MDFFALRFVTTSGSASADTNWLAVLTQPVRVVIRLPDGTDITNNSTSPLAVVVGQKIDLVGWVENLPANLAVTSRKWELTGLAVGGFVASLQEGRVLPLNLNDAATTFYWIAPSNSEGLRQGATFTAKLSDGREVVGSTTFLLRGPDIAGAAADPKLSSKFVFDRYPDGSASFSLSPPSFTVKPPGQGLPGIAGTYLWGQLILRGRFARQGSSNEVCDMPPRALDTAWPYPFVDVAGVMEDYPSLGIPRGDNAIAYEFSARAYALWQSTLPGSIPVPLGYVDWGFEFYALRDDQGSWIRRFRRSADAATFVNSVEYPIWSTYIVSYKYQNLKCS